MAQKRTSAIKNGAGSRFWQGQHQTENYPIRGSKVLLPKLRIRVWAKRFAAAWSQLGLEHSCLLRLPHCGSAHPATDGAAQHEQTIRLPFGTKFIEQIQN